MPRKVVNAAVEGVVDEAVASRLIADAGGEMGQVFGKSGRSTVIEKAPSYNSAAKHRPWFVLMDLDRDECPPALLADCLPPGSHARGLCFRIAVREVESWLLADRNTIARYLSVSRDLVPPDPESLADPKAMLVALASRSRARSVMDDMVPTPASGRRVGRLYVARLVEFVRYKWDLAAASKNSQSLRQCRRRLREIVLSAP